MTEKERRELAILQVADVLEDAYSVLLSGKNVMQTAIAMTSGVDGLRQEMSQNGTWDRYDSIAHRLHHAINDILSLSEDFRNLRKGEQS